MLRTISNIWYASKIVKNVERSDRSLEEKDFFNLPALAQVALA